jgi:hypothetical protein
VYIGSSVDIWQRWLLHASALRRQSHDCSALQKLWNLYGLSEDDFELNIIEETKDLRVREQYFLDTASKADIILNTVAAIGDYSTTGYVFGENHPNSKLTWDQVNHLRSTFDPELETHREKAIELGVSHVNIGNVLSYRSWKNGHKAPQMKTPEEVLMQRSLSVRKLNKAQSSNVMFLRQLGALKSDIAAWFDVGSKTIYNYLKRLEKESNKKHVR